MKKMITFIAAVSAMACSGGETRVYDFTVESNTGEQMNFAEYKGKVLLIVNTAIYALL